MAVTTEGGRTESKRNTGHGELILHQNALQSESEIEVEQGRAKLSAQRS
ncbi:hypothetical protein ACF05T_33605 [Streptomyces lateritius]|uniref:Uncharacterized protein n=1 Tax=Streptomyces lateritius TaxID=67313 RepID=A0ABW6YM23_9ACTN